MRDIDRAHRAVGQQADEILHQQFAGLRIQRRQRLVHQQDRRPHRERPRNADALAHAAGQLLWIGAAEIRQAGAAQRVIDDGAARRLASSAVCAQRKLDIGFHRAPGQQRKILEHEGQRIEAVGRRRAAQFRAALARLQQAAEDRQQRALAAAGGTDDRDHLARRDRERHVVEHLERAEAVADMVGDQVHLMYRSFRRPSLRGAQRRSGHPRSSDLHRAEMRLLRCARNDGIRRTAHQSAFTYSFAMIASPPNPLSTKPCSCSHSIWLATFLTSSLPSGSI